MVDGAIILTLAAGLAPYVWEVFKILAEKGLIEPGLGELQDRVRKPYNEKKAVDGLRSAMLAALDEMRADPGYTDFEHFIITRLVTARSAGELRMLAATAVDMTRPETRRIPARLVQTLVVDETRLTLLAEFLWRFRQKLADVDGYREGVRYANELDRRNLLAGIFDIEFRNLEINEVLLAERNLTTNEHDAAGVYLKDLREMLSDTPLPLVRRRSDAPFSAALEDIYTPLTLRDIRAEEAAGMRAKKSVKNDPQGEPTRGEEGHSVTLGQIVRTYPAFIFIGKPGCGKTTLLRRAGLSFVMGSVQKDLEWPDAPQLVPIYVRLRSFAAFLEAKRGIYAAPAAGALLAYVDHTCRIERNLDLTHDFFEKLLEKGECLVLLDGLDEVTDRRAEVAQQVCAFIRHYQARNNRFGLGSRPGGFEAVEVYLRGARLAVCHVNPMDLKGIQRLMEILFGLVDKDVRNVRRDARRLYDRVLTTQTLTELASTPLSCTTLVQVYKYGKEDLPQKRVDVFQEVVDLLLGFWKAHEGTARPDELANQDSFGKTYHDIRDAVNSRRKRLCRLAMVMQETRKAEIESEEAVAILAAHLQKHQRPKPKDDDEAREWAESFLYDSHERSGLLVELEAGRYAFLHQFFREYLAAAELLNGSEDDFRKAILEHAEDDWWTEVLRLAGAHYGEYDSKRTLMITSLLEHAGTALQRGKRETWLRCLLLAGRAAGDMGERLDGDMQDAVQSALIAAMTDSALEPRWRADAGDALDGMDWLPEDLYTCIEIPYPLNKKAPPAVFWMGKYPVTNLQYARFLDEENFRDESLWTGFAIYPPAGYQAVRDSGMDGWQWVQSALKNDNTSDGRVVYPRTWRDERFGIARRGAPVVGITWYEASAYCRWLERQWQAGECEEARANAGLPVAAVRLPLEAEWPAAAGGTDPKKRYPWDLPGQQTTAKSEILTRANVDEAVGRTTPVGMYPAGLSQPHGLADMAGNVWEWQANLYGKDQLYLALRGGSWLSDVDYARVAARGSPYPDLQWFNNGFRVLVLPSP